MTTEGAHRRRRTAVRLIAAAFAACLLGFVSTLDFSPRAAPVGVGEKVLPAFETLADDARLVMVTTADEVYHIVREPNGWIMPEKGRYPVRAEPLGDLAEGLSAMRYAQAMTTDPKKLDRLGLGDPLTGGTGALLEVTDGSGTNFATLIVGFKNGDVFVREPGEAQAWKVSEADLPPLQRAAQWLDLNIVALDALDISRVEIEPTTGRPYALEPLAEDPGAFRLAAPDDAVRLISSFAPTLPATALTRFRPVDVKPVSELALETPVGVHRTHTRRGLVYETSIYLIDGRYWVAIGAYAEEDDPELLSDLARFEEVSAGWAFGVSRVEFDAFTTPYEAIALPG